MDPVEPEELANSQPEKPKGRRKRLAVLILAVIIGLAGAAAFLLQEEPKSSPSPQPVTSLNPANIELKLFAKGLSNPTSIVSSGQANNPHLFVVDQNGLIRVVNSDGSVQSEAFLDISSKVQPGGEMGLLGLAFSPNYSNDGFFFVNYINKQQNTVIERYQVSADTKKADSSSGKTLLNLKQPYANHNGGDMVFGPDDGYLYVAVGDGGSGGDPENRAQNLNSLFGKILRLDVSQIPYKIPASNPFVGQASKAPEIWDYGLRNPWRISFDRQTHDLYLADVGQGDVEEINFEPAGGKGGNNYGWRCYEGSQEFNLTGCQVKETYILPVLEYGHSEGRCSVTGGYVYRGKENVALTGKYFYADYCNGELYSAIKQDGKWNTVLVLKSTYQISAFGQDNEGELYVADFATGNIYQIQDTAN